MEVALDSVSHLQDFIENAAAEDNHNDINLSPHWPSKGEILLQTVSARYLPDGNGPDTLRNISLSIPAGSKVGIYGRTGSGKSTLISTLFRMTNITTGSITIDGVDISTISPETVRSRFIGLAQQPYLIPGLTVRENLLSSAADDSLINILETVHLHDLITSHGGLDKVLDIDALSIGQRQLFACARALLRPGLIIVLDEPTSSLDAETRELIHDVVMERFRDRTVVMVLHHVQMFRGFDLVVGLRDGEVVEAGDPEALRTRDGGLFRALLASGGGE
ncbi:ABC multidrug transporter [Aspergillus sclerotialis]|uniref:ABC multidrug transporter n=1 Tax=Aspergillus sclerotialis TaxID=2070753 RepID=A0A3A2ZER5_9EURO|nr:ABC multidrug transporter [Aspergillus sclerotialis]